MKQLTLPDRPALTAIAAVLALSSTSALAQPAPANAPAETVIAPVEAASVPAVQDGASMTAPVAAPPLPQIAVEPTAPPLPQIEPVPAPGAQAPAPQTSNTAPRAERPASRAVARTQAPESDAPAPVAERPAPRSVAMAPAASPTVERSPQSSVPLAAADTVAPAPVLTPASDGDAPLWILGGGGVLLVLGIGAFVWSQRRREAEGVKPLHASPRVAFTPEAPQNRGLATAPVTRTYTPSVAPAFADRAAAAARPVTADGLGAARWPDLEAMVAAPPSEANPFVTRAKRMRRAKYLLAQGHAEPMVQAELPIAAPATAVTGNRQYNPQPVYDFGKASSVRRPNWKPATT